MSDQIPISLNNSDLFLNKDLTDTNREQNDTDNSKDPILKKRPSLGENNHLISLHTSYLLPPLNISPYLNKAVTSYLLTKQNLVNKDKKKEVEQSTGTKLITKPSYAKTKFLHATPKQSYTKTSSWYTKADNGENWNNKQNETLLPVTDNKAKLFLTFGRRLAPLRYELRSEFTLRNKAQVEATNKDDARLKSRLGEDKYLAPDQAKKKHSPSLFDVEIDSSTISSFSGSFLPVSIQLVLDKLNRKICSGVSREFVLVAINFILLSVLAVLQRSNYGKSSSLISDSGSHTILCASKMPNLTPFYLNTAQVRQYLHVNPSKAWQIKSGNSNLVRSHKVLTVPWKQQKQENFVGVFLGKPDIKSRKTGGDKANGNQIENAFCFSIDNKSKSTLSTKFDSKLLLKNQPNKSTDFGEDLIKPWYCIKACQTLSNKIIATRSIWQINNNFDVYNESTVRGFQYYLPFYKSQERVFVETDTIPSKRDTVYSKKKRYVTIHGRLSRAVSEFVLQKCFYKYGLLVVSPSTKPSEAQASAEADKGSFTKSQYPDEIKQRSASIETETKYATLGLAKTKFLHARDAIPVFCFLPDSLVRNTFVSGYQFPELQEKEVAYLFKKRAIFHFYFDSNIQTRLPLPKQSYAKTKLCKNVNFCTRYKANAKTSFLQLLCNPLCNLLCNAFPKRSLYVQKLRFNAKTKFLQRTNPVLVRNCFVMTNKSSLCMHGTQSKALLQNNSSYTQPNYALFGRTQTKQGFVPKAPTDEKALLENKTFFQKLFTQLTTPFRTFQSGDLVSQVLSTPFLINKNGVVVSQARRKCLPKRENGLPYLQMDIQMRGCNQRTLLPKKGSDKPKTSLRNKISVVQEPNLKAIKYYAPSLHSVGDLEMQYTQIDLDEIQSIKELFEKMGRDYEDYLRQPKDSLPALIISPSLEDDREIEEEGIQIFRKRDLVKNKTNNSHDKNGEPSIDPTLFSLTTTPELPEKKSIFGKTASKSEMQDHQLLVKNALRQAQEEIDNIARKEEKGTEKDKQVIPPLTRLEALYTIRNRERKREQAKDLRLDKGIFSYLRSCKNKVIPKRIAYKKTKFSSYAHKAQLFYRGGTKPRPGYTDHGCLTKTSFLHNVIPETKPTAKHVSLPIFENLFLYSDKPNYCDLNKYTSKQGFDTQSTWVVTPWLFSNFGDETICTDRKHSFFGEMSCTSKKLTAQEQKQIFQQKANPLLFESVALIPSTLPQRTRTFLQDKKFHNGDKPSFYKKAELDQNKVMQKRTLCKNSVFALHALHANNSLLHIRTQNNVSKSDPRNLDLTSVSSTVPLSLLSQLAPLNKANYNKSQALRFQIGAADRLSDLFLSKNRIYFYDTLSQNKACQGAAPKIKGTPLQSPVSHRVWQPKRMEPSTFRVYQRSKSTPVLPQISQKDWRKIVEWQLQKYFVEEDKRLLPLSLNNKQLKIKKINLYLPWVSIKQGIGSLNKQARITSSRTKLDLLSTNKPRSSFVFSEFGSCQPSLAWPLTRLDLTRSQITSNYSQDLFSEPHGSEDTTFNAIQNGCTRAKTLFLHKLRFGVNGEALHATALDGSNPVRAIRNKTKFGYSSAFFDTRCQTTNYWRLPTQQIIYTANRTKQDSVVPKYRFNNAPVKKPVNLSWIFTSSSAQQSSSLQTINNTRPTTNFHSQVALSKKNQGVCQNVFNESILFESVTKYSWLFVYTFVFVLMFKQLFTFVYKVGLKDFFVNFLNSDFGRTITSEDFRYSIQNLPLAELYRPTKRLTELFGLERNKVQLLEIVWFLRNNCQGRNGPRGVLLVGPPGVESVSVVQAIAGEANLPIIVQSLEKIAQDSEPQRQLEQLYTRAHKQAPCVLFLDQLDSIGARRDQLFADNIRGGISSNPFQKNHGVFEGEKYNVTRNKDDSSLYQNERFGTPTKQSSVTPGNKLNVVLRLLTILDGITQSSGVVTVATARDLTKLDPALLRPKRFDRRIYLSLPNQQDRAHLLKKQTQSIGHVKEMPWNYLSSLTENMSAADIRSAINYSLFRAVLKNSVHTVETLEYGIDCVKTLTDKRIEKNKDYGDSISSFK